MAAVAKREAYVAEVPRLIVSWCLQLDPMETGVGDISGAETLALKGKDAAWPSWPSVLYVEVEV